MATTEVLVLAFGVLIFAQQVGSPIAPPPAEVHVTNQITLTAPPLDPQAVTEASVMADQAFIVNVAQPVPVQWTNALCSLPNLWSTTPASLTYENAAVRGLAVKISLAATALLTLALIAQGLGHMAGNGLRPGRTVLALVCSIGNLTFWQWGIGLNNALTAAVGSTDLCSALIKPNLQIQTPAAGEAVGAPVLTIVYAVVSLFLLISLVFRLGTVDVLMAAGSLAAMCWATDQTEHIAQWYSRFSVATIFGQVLLVIGLEVAHVVSGIGNGLAGSILGVVVLLMCRGLLGMLGQQRMQHGGASMGIGLALLARRLVLRH